MKTRHFFSPFLTLVADSPIPPLKLSLIPPLLCSTRSRPLVLTFSSLYLSSSKRQQLYTVCSSLWFVPILRFFPSSHLPRPLSGRGPERKWNVPGNTLCLLILVLCMDVVLRMDVILGMDVVLGMVVVLVIIVIGFPLDLTRRLGCRVWMVVSSLFPFPFSLSFVLFFPLSFPFTTCTPTTPTKKIPFPKSSCPNSGSSGVMGRPFA